MSVAFDANVLIYTMNPASPHHAAANQALAAVFASGEPFWIFPPTMTAVLRVTTHPKILPSPLSLEEAMQSLRSLLAEPSAHLGLPTEGFVEDVAAIAAAVGASGNLIHDAEIVALMNEHGVSRIVTADRDFLRFRDIQVTLVER